MASRRSSCVCQLAFVAAALAALGQTAPNAQSTPPLPYSLRPIGQLGGAQSAAYDVDFVAQVIAGRAQTASGAYHAFTEGHFGLVDIGALGGRDSTAFGASSAFVVGQAQTASGQYHAFAFDFRRPAIDLGTLGGSWSAAYDANSQIVVGASRIAGDARLRAFQYAGGVMSALPVDLGGDSAARGVNDADDVVGYACTAGNASCRPFLLSSGVTTLIGAANRTGVATRVNLRQDVVGSLGGSSTTMQAFFYRNGVVTALGTLGGGTSEARGLNEHGEVVGTALNAAGQPRAFLWRGGAMVDVNTLIPPGTGWILESAAAIADGGQIAGYGTLNGKRRAFLLTPPTDLAAFAGGTQSQRDTNLPRDGIEVGKTVEWTTSVVAPPFNWQRTIYGARMTHTLTGPAVFISADMHDQGSCTVAASEITCDFDPFDSDGTGREVTVRARTTGLGAIEHRATVSGLSDPNGANNTVVETNRTVALATFTIAPSTVAGGQIATATVTLTGRPPAGDAVLTMTSSRPDVAAVPATFIVPSWTDHRELNIVPAVVSTPTAVTITASFGLVTITRTLTVVPPALKQLYLTPTTVVGGCGQSQGRVVLTGAAPAGGAVVPLTSTNTKAGVPPSVTVPAGSTSASFTVPTVPVTTPASGVVTATYGGAAQTLSLAVRPIRAQSLTLTSSRVRGGTAVNGTVGLECPAVPGAIAVTFTSSNPGVAAATATSITIPAGATTGSFSVRTAAVTSETTVTIYAWVFGVRRAVTLTVTP